MSSVKSFRAKGHVDWTDKQLYMIKVDRDMALTLVIRAVVLILQICVTADPISKEELIAEVSNFSRQTLKCRIRMKGSRIRQRARAYRRSLCFHT